MLHDDINYLYLIIIKPILEEFNRLNLTFQKNFVDIGKPYDDIYGLYMFLVKKIMKMTLTSSDINNIRQNISNESAYLPVDKCNFGMHYYQLINTLKIASDIKHVVDVKVLAFIKALLFELDKRFPDNLKLFQELQYFSPKQYLNQLHPKLSNLPFIHKFLEQSMFSSLEVQ